MNMEPPTAALEAFLLGQIDFHTALELQRRLIVEYRDRDDGQIALLLCEHPPLVTIGRGGSPGDVAMQNSLIRNRQIEVVWVNRGGGTLIHCPGQLAIYPIVPLRWHGFSVGEYLRRLQKGLAKTLEDVKISCQPTPEGASGLWGRTGQLATIAVAVRHGVTYYGAYLNVAPPIGLFRLVEQASSRPGRAKMGSLAAERRGAVKMSNVRTTLVENLADAFGCDRFHLYSGHPMLRRVR